MRPLVLLVNGHEDTRARYAVALAANGFDVVTVEDRGDPFTRAWEIHPDIIVIDVPTSNEDGWKLVQQLKQNPRTRAIPVVAVSGYVQQSLGERAERDGFAAVFPKSCLPEELAAGLRHVLDAQHHAYARP